MVPVGGKTESRKPYGSGDPYFLGGQPPIEFVSVGAGHHCRVASRSAIVANAVSNRSRLDEARHQDRLFSDRARPRSLEALLPIGRHLYAATRPNLAVPTT